MEHSKLYQYKDVIKVSAFNYSGKLAIKTIEDNQYDVSSPVNTTENYSINEDAIIINNTLNNEESMKFNFNFKVNKSAIGTGTNLLLDMPGLFSVKSESNTLWFKFYYEDAPDWKYINASELVDGWNNVALAGDGVKVTLTVNSAVHTVLDSSLKTTYVTYKGGQYKYLKMDETASLATADSWEIQTTYTYHKSGSASQATIFGYSGGSDYRTPTLTIENATCKLLMSSTASGWNLADTYTGFKPEDGKTYDIAVGFTGTQYYVKWRLFGTTEWTGNWTLDSTTKVYCSVPFYWLNLSLNDYNYYNAGELYMSNTKIIVNGETWFDGAGDTGFTNTDCTRNEIVEGSVYPSLSLGTLKTCQSWLNLKDIEALKIENQDSSGSSGGITKIEDAVNFEHTKSDLYTQQFDLHTKNKIAAGSTAIAYLDNPSDIYDNKYDVLVDRYNDDDEPGRPALVYTEDGLAYWLISNSKFPLYTQNVYGKLKPFYYNSNNEKVYLEENNINYRFKRNKSSSTDAEIVEYDEMFPEYIYTCIMPPIVKQPIECCYLNQNKDSIMNYSSERIINFYSKHRNLSVTIVDDSKITLCTPTNVHEYDTIIYNLTIPFQYKRDDGEMQTTSINNGYILDTKL